MLAIHPIDISIFGAYAIVLEANPAAQIIEEKHGVPYNTPGSRRFGAEIRLIMRLPNGERSFVDVAKLRDYCLSMQHPEGRHKARVFLSVLGLTPADAEELRAVLLTAARENEAMTTDADEYGQRYTVDFQMYHGGRQALVRSAWIIRRSEDYPRLTSCYIL